MIYPKYIYRTISKNLNIFLVVKNYVQLIHIMLHLLKLLSKNILTHLKPLMLYTIKSVELT